jgi:hypothetical protein
MPKMRTTEKSRPSAHSSLPAASPTAKRKAPRSISGRQGQAPAPTDDAAPAAQDRAVRVNLPGELLLPLELPEEARPFLQNQAVRWSYALRNRERWNTQSDAVREQQQEMSKLAAWLGLESSHLDRIAEVGIVEVDIPWVREEDDWELRIFPWEFLLATATHERRGGGRQPLTVVRRLRRQPPRPRPARTGDPANWLHVISAPGPLAAEYDFDSERRLLKLSVEAAKGKLKPLPDPDEEALRREIAGSPDVIHLSGFDSHQGLELLRRRREGPVRDGFLLRAGEGEKVVEAEPLADLLTSAPGPAPALVACNFYNSGARIAPLCVAVGAAAAIGFQDSFDDELAELFFTVLYQAWSLADWDIVAAFQYAWHEVRDQRRPLQGSAVVLWSEESIGEPAPVALQAPIEARQEQIRIDWEKRSQQAPAPTRDTIRDLVEVDVEPIRQLNYAILHNDGPLFRRFLLRKKSAKLGRVDGIQVDVELYVGTDSYPFRLQETLEETASLLPLTDRIRVSLAAQLSRAIRESIHTSLFTQVTWRDVVLHRSTERVTLLPVDEWRLDRESSRWLPSFVLPRDPAVLRVIDAAQRYLMALRDDATAGFDGYQCVAPPAAGGKVRPEDCASVDLQVRALWSALLYETPLSYINPPPSFTEASQRLRTPSDCIDGRRGTCIDIALLMAACLEYVDIYPVVFLLRTHAFPAYWRHDTFHSEFRKALSSVLVAPVDGQPSAATGQSYAWAVDRSQYREILGEVQAGRLVPLETTLVTGRGSFADAVVDGVQNLAHPREFESMLDILLARTDEQASVTPLPVRRGEA